MPVAFEVEHTGGLSRLGTLETPHGTVQTPALMPVVNPHRRTVEPAELRETFGAQMLITNAYILYTSDRLGETVLEEGVHEVLDYDGPLMTDSGTFQDYVYDGVDVEPREIVDFQRRIDTDVATILDVFSTPDRSREEAREDATETRDRAAATLDAAGDTALALPVQGATFPKEREHAARAMGELSPTGGAIHPIGGVVPLMEAQRYATLFRAVLGAQRGLHAGRPVHLFGAGHPQMLPLAVYLGCDLFDSAAYAKFAHDDRLLFPWGTEHLDELDELPCTCPICTDATPADLAGREGAARTEALARHNLHVTLREMRRVRQAQRSGRLFDLVVERAATHPRLAEALPALEAALDLLEAREPISRKRAVHLVDHAAHLHPQRDRARRRVAERTRPRGPVALLAETDRPFTRNRADLVRELRARGVHPLFPSRLGPVPFDLDEAYPFSQSLEPPLSEADREEQRRRARELAKRWGVDLVDPETALEAEPERDPDELDLVRERVAATAAYQLGPAAADALLDGELEVETSPRTGRVRTVHVDGEHVLSRRPYDGLFTVKLAGARRLHAALDPPRRRVQVPEDSARFNADGKTVFAKFVEGVDDALRPRDECLVVDPADRLVAVGRLRVTPEEARALASGPAAEVREGAGRAAYEDAVDA